MAPVSTIVLSLMGLRAAAVSIIVSVPCVIIILSFTIFLHGLCWVPAERTVHKLIGFTKKHTDLLDLALKIIYHNKSELLLVLDRPDIPLHNNLSENDWGLCLTD